MESLQQERLFVETYQSFNLKSFFGDDSVVTIVESEFTGMSEILTQDPKYFLDIADGLPGIDLFLSLNVTKFKKFLATQSELSSLNSDVSTLTQRLKESQSETSDLTRKYETQIKALRQSLEKILFCLDSKESKVQELKLHVDDLVGKNEKLNGQLTEKDTMIKGLKENLEQIGPLKTKLAELENENAKKLMKIKELDHENNILKETVSNVMIKNSKLDLDNQELTKKYEENDESYDAYITNNLELNAERYLRWQTQTEKLEGAKKRLQNKVSWLEKRIDSVTDRNALLREKLLNSKERNNHFKVKLKLREKMLALADERLRNSEEKLDSCYSENQRLLDKILDRDIKLERFGRIIKVYKKKEKMLKAKLSPIKK